MGLRSGCHRSCLAHRAIESDMNADRITRRDFFRGATVPNIPKNRAPWIDYKALTQCTGCNDCVLACPEGILTLDEDQRPIVDFSTNGCTFCGDCAASCAQGVFGATSQPAWQVRLMISQKCLLAQGVSCEICTDFCDYDALWFDLSRSPAGALRMDQSNCTGCGMCVGACPVRALSLVPADQKDTA